MSSDETKSPSSSDTLEPEPWSFEDQSSPDLFDECNDKPARKSLTLGNSGTEASQDRMEVKMKKEKSKTHDISDSGSDTDNDIKPSKISPIKIAKNSKKVSRQEKVPPKPSTFLEDIEPESPRKVIKINKYAGKLTSKQKIERSLVSSKAGNKDTKEKDFPSSLPHNSQKKSSSSNSSKSNKEEHKPVSPSPSLKMKHSKDSPEEKGSKDEKSKRIKDSPSSSSDNIELKRSTSLKRKHSKDSPEEKTSKDEKSKKIKDSPSFSADKIILKRSDTDIVSEETRVKRKHCPYGKDCYRKNPSHFKEFNHPGNETKRTPMKTQTENPEHQPPPKKKSRQDPSPSPSGSSKNADSSPASKSNKSNGATEQRKSDHKKDTKSNSQPSFSFYLTKVSGIADKYNAEYTMDIKDILAVKMGELKSSCQFNYMFEISWLVQQYPPQFRSKPLLLVHGEQHASKAALQADAMNYSNIKFCQAKLEMIYGTHHTKMMFLLYETGLRVVIHTSNLVKHDWNQKTQGMWISPVFPKLSSPGVDKGDSVTHFKKDLIDYVSAYKAYQLKEWVEHLTAHDMSSARVCIIGSVPGRHLGNTLMSNWGHMKLRRILREHGPSATEVKSWPVIGQFSSIGSLGPTREQWLCGEFLQSLSSTRTATGLQGVTRLQLVFPSRDNVRLSLEGWPAGGSIPYSIETAKKQTYLHNFWHEWKSEGRGRSRAMPHIKTYIRPSTKSNEAAWFLVTSANLSKAAWGMFEKKGAQLMIRSYELGVLFLPKFLDCGDTLKVTSNIDEVKKGEDNKLLLPYDLPTTRYQDSDRPWVWDIPYMYLPDSHGNMWCPKI